MPDLSTLPRVDRVLAVPDVAALRSELGAKVTTELVRAALDAVRRALQSGERDLVPDAAEVAGDVAARAHALRAGRARRVINATGVVLHTNLGRAPLSERAADAVARAGRGYCSIELDLETGKRGRRGAFMERALATLSGAPAALVLNNCAGAVLLLLAAVARGGDVIVSRGELVEIGGGFRVPEIMAESGARLVEIGTTNRTRVADYAAALDAYPGAAAILRVHQGNFRQLGFVERPRLEDLGALARARGVPLLKDLGGGALVRLEEAGFEGEPTVASCVEAGCAAVTFSTDKVLGGPQGGALVGDAEVVERARRHPLARALRIGRLPMVALEATLDAYRTGAAAEVPAPALAHASRAELELRATRWAAHLAERGIPCEVVASETEMGGGTLAARTIPSVSVAVRSTADRAAALAQRLRANDPPIVARIAEDRVLLDVRTVRPDEDETLLRGVAWAASVPGEAPQK